MRAADRHVCTRNMRALEGGRRGVAVDSGSRRGGCTQTVWVHASAGVGGAHAVPSALSPVPRHTCLYSRPRPTLAVHFSNAPGVRENSRRSGWSAGSVRIMWVSEAPLVVGLAGAWPWSGASQRPCIHACQHKPAVRRGCLALAVWAGVSDTQACSLKLLDARCCRCNCGHVMCSDVAATRDVQRCGRHTSTAHHVRL